MSDQIQSTELPTLTSANKVDSMFVVLQGIHKVCVRLACWSAYLLKHNSGIFVHLPCFIIFSILTKFSTAASLLNYLQIFCMQLYRFKCQKGNTRYCINLLS